MKRISVVAAVLLLPVLSLVGPASPAGAVPATRWASPTGTGTACTQASPCDLDTAVESPTVNAGDEVIVTPGSYAVTQLSVNKAIFLHGQVGQPAPTITTNDVFGVAVQSASTLSDLHITSSLSGTSTLGLFIGTNGATIERVTSAVTVGGSNACTILASAVVRDSVCWATGVNTRGSG